MKEKALDKVTIDTYHAWVQAGIRKELNSVSLGPGKLPYRTGVFMVLLALCCLLTGILLVALRMRHVYLWDWDSQFLGPFFIILFLLCMAAAAYLFILAKRKTNKYRSELYFKPVGDWGAQCIHASELAHEDEIRHDLKSGTTPHKTVKPSSAAYSQSGKEARKGRPPAYRGDGRDNHAYDKSPLEHKPGERRRGHPPDGRRGPPPEGRRGPPPPGYRGPPPEGRRGPPPEGRRGPPPEGRRGPPPEGRRGPPPEGRRGPPPEDRRRPPDVRGPPPDYEEQRRPDDRRPPPNGNRGPPPPGGAARLPPDEQSRRPRGVPRFNDVEQLPDEDRRNVKLIMDRSREESDI